MASMTGLNAQELQQLLGSGGMQADTMGPAPSPSYSPSDFYSGRMAPPSVDAITKALMQSTLPPAGTNLNPAMPARPNNSWPGGSDSPGYGPESFAQLQGLAGDPAYGESRIPLSSGGFDVAKNQTQLNSPPLAAYGEQPSPTPGEQAIVDILVRGGMHPPSGGTGRGRHTLSPGMVWDPAQSVGPAPQGDPRGGLRLGQTTLPNVDGMVTGAPQMAPAGRPAPSGPIRPAAELHARLMAQQTDKKSSRPGGSFLEAQGVDTSRMTAGELANALNKAIF